MVNRCGFDRHGQYPSGICGFYLTKVMLILAMLEPFPSVNIDIWSLGSPGLFRTSVCNWNSIVNRRSLSGRPPCLFCLATLYLMKAYMHISSAYNEYNELTRTCVVMSFMTLGMILPHPFFFLHWVIPNVLVLWIKINVL